MTKEGWRGNVIVNPNSIRLVRHNLEVRDCFSLDSLNKRARLAVIISGFALAKSFKNNMIYRKLCAAGTAGMA